MKKATLSANQIHCTRCSGDKLVYKMVLNGQAIPHHPNYGVCYRCNGTGIDPHITQDMVERGDARYYSQMAQYMFEEKDKQRFFSTFAHIMGRFEQKLGTTYLSIKDKDALNKLINKKFVQKIKIDTRTYVEPTKFGTERYVEICQSYNAKLETTLAEHLDEESKEFDGDMNPMDKQPLDEPSEDYFIHESELYLQ